MFHILFSNELNTWAGLHSDTSKSFDYTLTTHIFSLALPCDAVTIATSATSPSDYFPCTITFSCITYRAGAWSLSLTWGANRCRYREIGHTRASCWASCWLHSTGHDALKKPGRVTLSETFPLAQKYTILLPFSTSHVLCISVSLYTHRYLRRTLFFTNTQQLKMLCSVCVWSLVKSVRHTGKFSIVWCSFKKF